MRLYQIKVAFLSALFVFANIAGLKADSYYNDDCCYDQVACWDGFYLNGQIGGAWAKHHETFTNNNYFNTNGPELLGSRFDSKSDGFIGGAALGYNYQCGAWVIGLEGGALGTSLKKSQKSPFFPDTDTFSSKLDWIGNAKVRIGYAFNSFLPFVYGGWAGGNVKLKLHDSFANVSAKTNKWINGWTVGAGVDYKINDCFSVGIAYDYIQLEHKNKVSCLDCGVGEGLGAPNIKSCLDIQTLVLRVNYHLNFFQCCY